jgi:hypothetical protein
VKKRHGKEFHVSEKTDSRKIGHLGLIMSLYGNQLKSSQTVRQWSISLTAAFLAISTQQQGFFTAYMSLFPIALLWMLDAQNIQHELMLLAFYNRVRNTPEADIDFDLDYRFCLRDVHPWPYYLLNRRALTFNSMLIFGLFAIDWFIK